MIFWLVQRRFIFCVCVCVCGNTYKLITYNNTYIYYLLYTVLVLIRLTIFSSALLLLCLNLIYYMHINMFLCCLYKLNSRKAFVNDINKLSIFSYIFFGFSFLLIFAVFFYGFSTFCFVSFFLFSARELSNNFVFCLFCEAKTEIQWKFCIMICGRG